MSFNKTINVNGFLLKINKDRKIELVGTKRKEIEIIKEFEEGYLGKTYLIDFYGKKAVLKFPLVYRDKDYIEIMAKAYIYYKFLRKMKFFNVPKIFESNLIKINESSYGVNSKYFVPYIITEYIEGEKLKEEEFSIKKLAKLIAEIHKNTIHNKLPFIWSSFAKKRIKIKSEKINLENYIPLDMFVSYYVDSLNYEANRKYYFFLKNFIKRIKSDKNILRLFKKNFLFVSLFHGDLSFNNIIVSNNKIFLIDPSLGALHYPPFRDLSKIYRHLLLKNKENYYKKFLNYYIAYFFKNNENKEHKQELFDFLIRIFHLHLSISTLWFFKIKLKQDNEFLRKVEEICDKDYELLTANIESFLKLLLIQK